MEKKRYRVKLGSLSKVEELLQETYDLACKHILEIQTEMNKLAASCNLSESTVDEKAKIAKAMHDFICDKNRAINMKMDVAKFMGEIYKHNGDVEKALNEASTMKAGSLNLSKIRMEIDSINQDGKDGETYNLKGE